MPIRQHPALNISDSLRRICKILDIDGVIPENHDEFNVALAKVAHTLILIENKMHDVGIIKKIEE